MRVLIRKLTQFYKTARKRRASSRPPAVLYSRDPGCDPNHALSVIEHPTRILLKLQLIRGNLSMFTGRKLALTIAFTVLVALAFGVGCRNFFQPNTLTAVSIQPQNTQGEENG